MRFRLTIILLTVLILGLNGEEAFTMDIWTQVIFGEVYEEVFAYSTYAQSEFMLSQLIWEIRNPIELGGTLSYQFSNTTRLRLESSLLLTEGTGNMYDYDWLWYEDYGFEDYTKYSRSDVFLSGFSYGGDISRVFLEGLSWELRFGLGLTGFSWHWRDEAREYVYSPKSYIPSQHLQDTGNFNGDPAISYWYNSFYPGVFTELHHGDSIQFSHQVSISPFFLVIDKDFHILRDLFFLQVYNSGVYGHVITTVDIPFAGNGSLYIRAWVDGMAPSRSDVYNFNGDGLSLGISPNGGGSWFWRIGFGSGLRLSF
jgi:outer membrane protease